MAHERPDWFVCRSSCRKRARPLPGGSARPHSASWYAAKAGGVSAAPQQRRTPSAHAMDGESGGGFSVSGRGGMTVRVRDSRGRAESSEMVSLGGSAK